jgi:hypothetical protein
LPFSNINPLFLVLVLLYQMTAFMYTLHTAPKKYWLGFLALNYPLMFVQIYALMRAITIKKDVFVRTRKAEENTLAR